jgi:hypothetical protein
MGTVRTGSFERLAGWLALFVGAGGLAYGILFAAIVEGASGAVVNAWLLLAIFGGLAASGLSLIPPPLYGLVVHPVLYVWLGREFLRLPAEK